MNKTSKAGKVLPKCLTRPAITINRNAPIITQKAPLIFGEIPIHRATTDFIRGELVNLG